MLAAELGGLAAMRITTPMNRFTPVALLAILACRPADNATSATTGGRPVGFTAYDSGGQTWARLSSNRWLVGHTVTPGSPARLLLQEQATTRCCIYAERESDTRLELTGWIDSLDRQRQLWHAVVAADRGALWGS